MLTFAKLQNINIVRQKEWDPDSVITLAYRGNELAGEIGEACNVIKKIVRERLGLRGTRATKQELGAELADAVICIALICNQEGIDLGEATTKKFNETSEKYGLNTRI